MGFSAGGHLAGSIGLRFDALAPGRSLARPCFLALIYPVVSARSGIGHGGSFRALQGGDARDPMISEEEFSIENHVHSDSPPMFLVHAADDATVPVANSQLLAEAARMAGSPATLHICKSGGHGFGMGRPGSDAASWIAPCEAWLRRVAG